ncbi:hypothetical protein FKM82_019691 [Ascaphus truei]
MVSKSRSIYTSIVEFPGISTLNPFSMRSNELVLVHGVLWISGWMGAMEDDMGVPWREAAASSKKDGGGDLWISGREAAASSMRDGESDRWISGREAAESSKRNGESDPLISGRQVAASSKSSGEDGL